MKVFCYHAEISDGKGMIPGRNEFTVKEFDVIARNESYCVINDYAFTTLSLAPDKYREALDDPSVSVEVADKIWGSRVTYTQYTTKKVKAKTIKAAMEKAVLKKVGYFMNGIDLGIVKDARDPR